MDTDDRRLAAGLVAALCGVVLIVVPVIAVEAPGYVRWSHAGVLAAAAFAFGLGALAYLHGTREAAPAMTPQEITTAWYLKSAAWLPPVVFAGTRELSR